MMIHGSGTSESHSEEGIQTLLPHEAPWVAAVWSALRAHGAARTYALPPRLAFPASQPAYSPLREPAASIPLCIH